MTLNSHWSREGGESRTEEYRIWRTTLGVGAVSDLDQLEYRASDGRALLAVKLCVADQQSEECPGGVRDGHGPSVRFLEAVVKKVDADRPQGRLMRWTVNHLGIPWILVVYIKGDLDRGVWVKRMDDPGSPWQAMTLADYARRLRLVHDKSLEFSHDG